MPFGDLLDVSVGLLPIEIRRIVENAVDCVDYAGRIREIDPGMAQFRLLLAQEEIAKAVFEALRHKAYPSARNLKPSLHEMKSSLFPYLQGVIDHFKEFGQTMGLRHEVQIGRTTGEIRLILRSDRDLPGHHAIPTHPLLLTVSLGGDRLTVFDKAVGQHVDLTDSKPLESKGYELSRQRINIQYAGPDHLRVQTIGEADVAWTNEVIRLATLFVCLVMQGEHRMPLPMQMIYSFLALYDPSKFKTTERRRELDEAIDDLLQTYKDRTA